MKENIKKHLEEYNQSKGWPTDEDSLVETLIEAPEIWAGDESEHRWWVTYTKVVEINGMFIAIGWARTTGDDSPQDKGWEFDPEYIWEVEPTAKTITVYVAKKD